VFYRFVSFSVTLDDLEGHLAVVGLIKCNSTNTCAFRMVSADMTIAEIVVKILLLADSVANLTTVPCDICSLAVPDPRVSHTMDVLSPFIPVRCHSD